MKKCSYCGVEYPDDAVRCSTDNELLPGEEPPPPPPLLREPEIIPPPPVYLTERQMRFIELVLVCAIAFAGNLLSATHSLYLHSTGGANRGNYAWFYAMVRQVACLGLLWYVLRRNGRTFSTIGFNWARSDWGWSIVLYLLGSLAFRAVYYSIQLAIRLHLLNPVPNVNVDYFLFGSSVASLAILFQFLNPFFEELIARAYVMTEVKALTHNVGKAIFISIALQTAYHVYQGMPAALSHGACFLVYSIYYAKTNRITPLVLAHLYGDVIPTLAYAFHHGG